MIVDSSALAAILLGEADAGVYLDVLLPCVDARVPSPVVVETTLVLSRLGGAGPLVLDRLMQRAGLEVISFTAAHAVRAQQAFAVYGRGSGHRARLNFGDCLVYAVATVEGEPLLFKGDDFTHTDVVSALGRRPG